MPAPPGEEAMTAEALTIITLENAGTRFLRRKLRYIAKASEREYLNEMLRHSHALFDLLLSFHEMRNTAADPFLSWEITGRRKGDERSASDYRDEVVDKLLALSAFATARLRLGDAADQTVEEQIRKRTNYPQFILICDLLACYQRITGRQISASVRSTKTERKVSPAVDFISVAVPPVLKAARLPAPHKLGDEAVKKEVALAKRLWANGHHPELEYVRQDWANIDQN